MGETLEKLINTVHEIHNVTSSHVKLFAGEHNPSLFRMLYRDALGIQQYATKLCRGYRFSNIVKIVLFISDVQNYIAIKLCKTSGSIHLFKIKGTLKPGDIKLNRNYLWDTLEINWNKIMLTFHDNKIDLPKIITIKMQDKIRVRRMISKEPLNFHMMIRPGITWYTLEIEIETV